MIQITKFVCGPLQENCYLVTDPTTEKAILIDPGSPDQPLLEALKKLPGKLTGILLTHGHFDHIGGINAVEDISDVPVFVHSGDAPMLTDGRKNLSLYFGKTLTCNCTQKPVEDGDEISFGAQSFRALHTPGHSGGSVCYIGDGVLFSGDTLFAGSIGRTDFPGSDEKQMALSLEKLQSLPGDYQIYPGHGPQTTLSTEKLQNLYFRNEL